MAAPHGNKFWTMRGAHGRKRKIVKAETLWDACCAYFDWVEANPLEEQKLFAYQGVVTKETSTKMRAMTIIGLCLHIGIDQSTWEEYRKVVDFHRVTTRVDNIIREQKFTGAAADLLNANIIARDLGLTDKQEVDHTGSVSMTISAEDAEL